MHAGDALSLLLVVFDIHFTAIHIAGMYNDAADLLSRNHIRHFYSMPQGITAPRISTLFCY